MSARRLLWRYKHYLTNNRSGGFYDTFLFTVQKALPLMQDGA